MAFHDPACVPPRRARRTARGAGRRRRTEAVAGRRERILALLEIQIPPEPPSADAQILETGGAERRERAPASFVA